ncbi:uncharacterized protein LOC141719949 [Apium graveolens]|uniref:uncharacterized protein LOC141719949 n=1 Tax=Apium graveolens TaxID=4045 RepID=UPI003D78D378
MAAFTFPNSGEDPRGAFLDTLIQPPAKVRRLSNLERNQIVHILSINYNNQKLKKGIINKIASDYGVSRVTISKLWQKVLQSTKKGEVPNVQTNYKGGSQGILLDLEKVRSIHLHLRTNVRTLACQLGASKSKVHRLIQKGKIKSHSNALKPFLTPSNMEARVNFVLKHIESSTLHIKPTYIDMFSIVHIDEKWFYMTRTSQKCYLLPDEQEPHRRCKSKRFITKIMFMSAVARPRYDADGNCTFDGKIAIKAKWPLDCNRPIVIQQDNARPHICNTDLDFIEVAKSDGFNITLANQSANSPDLNINDLGFFRIIQGLQHEKAPTTVCELVGAVIEAYE